VRLSCAVLALGWRWADAGLALGWRWAGLGFSPAAGCAWLACVLRKARRQRRRLAADARQR
jgi:hypothetical protein